MTGSEEQLRENIAHWQQECAKLAQQVAEANARRKQLTKLIEQARGSISLLQRHAVTKAQS